MKDPTVQVGDPSSGIELGVSGQFRARSVGLSGWALPVEGLMCGFVARSRGLGIQSFRFESFRLGTS